MNRQTVTVALLLVGLSGCSGPAPVNMSTLVTQGPEYLNPKTMSPYTGPVYRLDPSDSTNVTFSGRLKDGVLEGPYEDYRPFGIGSDVKGGWEEGEYAGGIRQGEYKIYYMSGKIRTEGTYSDGVKANCLQSWWENGSVRTHSDCEDSKMTHQVHLSSTGDTLWVINLEGKDHVQSRRFAGDSVVLSTYLSKKGDSVVLDGPSKLWIRDSLIEQKTFQRGKLCGVRVQRGDTIDTGRPCLSR